MKKFLFLSLLICLLLSIPEIGDCATRTRWGQGDTYMFLRRELPYDLIYIGHDRGGVSRMVTKPTEIPLGYSLVEMICSTKTNTIANGFPGQVIDLVAVDETGTLTILPATSTGWAYATMDADGETLRLQYHDDTYGWTVAGYSGTTITAENSQ